MMMVRDGRDILGQLLSLVMDNMDDITAFHLSPMTNVISLNGSRLQK